MSAKQNVHPHTRINHILQKNGWPCRTGRPKEIYQRAGTTEESAVFQAYRELYGQPGKNGRPRKSRKKNKAHHQNPNPVRAKQGAAKAFVDENAASILHEEAPDLELKRGRRNALATALVEGSGKGQSLDAFKAERLTLERLRQVVRQSVGEWRAAEARTDILTDLAASGQPFFPDLLTNKQIQTNEFDTDRLLDVVTRSRDRELQGAAWPAVDAHEIREVLETSLPAYPETDPLEAKRERVEDALRIADKLAQRMTWPKPYKSKRRRAMMAVLAMTFDGVIDSTVIEQSRKAAKELDALADKYEARRAERRRWEAARREANRRYNAWEKSLIGVRDLRERLNATDTEVKRWIADGRIPVAKYQTFEKWGRRLTTTLHDPANLPHWQDKVAEWRTADADAKREKRREAARKAAATRQRQKDAEPRPHLVHRRLTRLANDIENGPAGLKDWWIRETGDGVEYVLNGVAYHRFAITDGHDPAALVVPLRYELRIPHDAVAPVTAPTMPRGQKRRDAIDRLHNRLEAAREPLDAIIDRVRPEIIEKAADVLTRYPAGSEAALVQAWRSQIHAMSGDQLTLTRHIVAGNADLENKLKTRLQRCLQASTRELAEVRGVNAIQKQSGLHDYPGLFPAARAMQRRLRYFVGPTNSGKTHSAMATLADARSGVYAAPLRLMAMEAHERLNADHRVPCSMRTGEERIDVGGAQHVAATIEMVDIGNPVDVAVIDEAQMLGDANRGWAWTQAIVGVPAREVIMTGSPEGVPRARELARMTGEELDVVEFDRKTPLEALSAPVAFRDVQAGDAVVTFSKRSVLETRQKLQRQGHRVATVYGDLSPEVRRTEARRFREGEADVVVATDAVGMGLNLPVHRVILAATSKFDGQRVRPLTPYEIRQIGGRAGRYGLSEKGYAGVLDGAGAPEQVITALRQQPRTPTDVRPWVRPAWRAIATVAEFLVTDRLVPVLDFLHRSILANDHRLRSAINDDLRKLARVLDKVDLDLPTRYAYLGAPIDSRSQPMWSRLNTWTRNHVAGQYNRAPSIAITNVPTSENELQKAETGVKSVSLYLWLHDRWPDVYPEADAARSERQRLNELIVSALQRKEFQRSCRDCGRGFPRNSPHPICDRCFMAGKRKKAMESM